MMLAIAFAAFVVGAASATSWMEWLRSIEDENGN
mgnify:CR=1 FL=1